MKEWIAFLKEMWWIILIIVLAFAWGIFYTYIDIKAKWSIAHLENCPCITEMKNDNTYKRAD